MQLSTISNYRNDRKIFIVYFIVLTLVFVGVTLSPVVTTVVASFCILMTFFGPMKTMQAMSLLVLIRFMNPALVTYSSNLSLFNWAILIIASLINIPWGLMNISKKVIPIIFFSVFAALLSVITSGAVWISIMKIMSFLLASLTVISIFNKLNTKQIRNVVIWLFALMFVVVALSALTLFNHNIAYNLNGSGFQGILNHPQTMGVFLVPPSCFFIGRFMFCKKDIVSFDIIIIISLVFFILITQARTAALAVFLSFSFTFFILNLSVIRAKIKSKSGFAFKVFFSIFLLVCAVSVYPSLQDIAHDFIFKRESKGFDEALSSRTGGLSSQLEGFLKSPLLGNGFGVYPGSVPATNIQYFMGVPISAAVEKGFLPTALLEEVGLVGVVPFLFMMYSIMRQALKSISPSWLCMFFGSIFINIGEYVFFATGGIGIFYWIIMTLCTVTYKIEVDTK